MLDETAVNHLNLLYEQLIKFNSEIKKAIVSANIELAANSANDKQRLIEKITAFERPYIDEIKKNSYLYSKRLEIAKCEQENIELLKNLKEEARKKLNNITKTKRIFSAYEPSINNTQSTFELKDTD